MLNKRFSYVWLPIAAVLITVSEPAYCQETSLQQALKENSERNEEIERLKNSRNLWVQLLTTETTEVIRVTKVEVNTTDNNLEIILVTEQNQQLQVSPSTEGNSYIADIANAQLELLSGDRFQQDNPAPGIVSIVATNLNANTIRVEVTGEFDIPEVRVLESSDLGLVFDIATEEEIEIIVTGEKTEENLQDVPISITPITEGEIQDGDVTSVTDISKNVPNFTTFSPSRNFVFYSIRGLSNFNFLAPRDPVAFYIDDVPYDYNGFLGVEIPDIDRVEVLRGPQATLYGRNAQAGVVNIITRQPSNDFEFTGTTGYANYDNPELRTSVSVPLVEDKLFFRLSGSYEYREGYTQNIFLDRDIDFQSGGTGRAKLLWNPTENWDISFNASLDRYEDGPQPFVFLDSPDPFETQEDFFGFSNLNNNTQSIKVDYDNPNFRFISISSRRFSDQEYELDSDASIADFITQVVALNSTVLSQEIRFQSPKDAEKFQWLLAGYLESREFNLDDEGFRYGSDPRVGLFGLSPGLQTTRAETNQDTYAIFGQASYKFIDALTLKAGLRFESSSSALDNQQRLVIPADRSSPVLLSSFDDIEENTDIFLPRFVLQYRFLPNIMTYGSIAKGYKPAAVNYRAASEELLLVDTEISWNYELGLKFSWLEDRLKLNTAFFYNPVDGFQVPVPNELGFFADITNADVDIAGLEIELRATPVEGFDAIAGFGYANAEFESYVNPFTGESFNGNKLPYAPDLTYNLALQYRAPIGIFARVELQGVGTTFFDDANELKQEPFALVNARLGYEFDDYGVYLYGNNIFNTEHLTTAASFFLGDLASYAPPATYGFQFRRRF